MMGLFRGVVWTGLRGGVTLTADWNRVHWWIMELLSRCKHFGYSV